MNSVELEAKALANLIAEEIGTDAKEEATIADTVAWLIEFGYLGPSYTWPTEAQETIKHRMKYLSILHP